MVDVKKVWVNAYKYNPKGTPIYLMTVEMDKYFEKLLREDNVPISIYETITPPVRGTVLLN